MWSKHAKRVDNIVDLQKCRCFTYMKSDYLMQLYVRFWFNVQSSLYELKFNNENTKQSNTNNRKIYISRNIMNDMDVTLSHLSKTCCLPKLFGELTFIFCFKPDMTEGVKWNGSLLKLKIFKPIFFSTEALHW